MLEWTGERFLPWAKEATVAYEHLHRYIWASNLVKGKRVLDLACGEGYGANILAAEAAFVCGVDIDPQTVEHAGRRYGRPNLQFLQGDITAVPISGTASFDVVVCFEAIEHIAEHSRLFGEVVRLLKPNGLFIVSTPNKEVYKTGPEETNPFHVKELTFAEFGSLLSSCFAHVQYLGQRAHPGSTLWPMKSPSAVQEFAIARVGEEFQPVAHDQRVAEYYIAVASNGGMESVAGSVLFDHSDELIREKDRELEAFREGVAQRDEALEWRAGQVETLGQEKTELLKRIEETTKDLKSMRAELETIHASRTWKTVAALRKIFKRGLRG